MYDNHHLVGLRENIRYGLHSIWLLHCNIEGIETLFTGAEKLVDTRKDLEMLCIGYIDSIKSNVCSDLEI